MDWFERLTGFTEAGYHETRARLSVDGSDLVSAVNGRRHGIGEFEVVSLQELRDRLSRSQTASGRLRVQLVMGEVRQLHQQTQYDRAVFQVASQFNMLEMISPEVTPERGVTRYQRDPTQGPACAIAAGAATIYRNYFAPVGDQIGQTRDRQLDGLADVGHALAAATGMPVSQLWVMRNGYALCTLGGLAAIDRYLPRLDETQLDALRARLRVGLHWQAEVTDAPGPLRPTVTQVFCSALPVAYTRIPADRWEAFAQLVLDAAYEATLLAGLLNAQRKTSNVVLLTRLGGGAFGNDKRWIDMALCRALARVADRALDVHLVTRTAPSPALTALCSGYS